MTELTVGRMGLMQTVLNQKPSCRLKGGLAFLMGKGGQDGEVINSQKLTY